MFFPSETNVKGTDVSGERFDESVYLQNLFLLVPLTFEAVTSSSSSSPSLLLAVSYVVFVVVVVVV